MNIYSSGDILLTYKSYIQNNPLSNLDLPLYINSFVKIDEATGKKTIWAKEVIDYSSKKGLEIYKTFLLDDIAWSLFSNFFPGINTPGIIVRIDINGNLVEIFYAPFNVNIYSSFEFYVYDFLLILRSMFYYCCRLILLQWRIWSI